MSDGFVDIRLNRQEGQGNESFWPSFTDIMTVVVMIFLIAMVVLLIRNNELVAQVRATMEAEREAAELARSTGELNEDLALRLHTAENRVAELQLELMRQQERGQQKSAVIERQQQDIQQLIEERDDITQKAAQLALIRQTLEADLDAERARLATAQQNISGLEQNLSSLQQRFATNQQQLSEIQEKAAKQLQELEEARRQQKEIERKYLVLVGEHDDLQVKYDKLVKPARSPKGRYLVEVRYWKDAKGEHINYRELGRGKYQTVTMKQLEQHLAKLKKQKKNGLYIKVVFPEKSGLSYSEAWKFTSGLHKKFDYYFSDPANQGGRP